MKRAYLESLGYTDATLAAEYTRLLGLKCELSAKAEDSEWMQTLRRLVFDAVAMAQREVPARTSGPIIGAYADTDPTVHATFRS